MRHAADKATTQREGRAASVRCTGRRRASAGKAARRSVVLSYRRDMPARTRPAPEDAVTARQTLLDGLARDADIFELLSELAPPHPRDNTFPGEVFLHVAADALDWCRASRADPLPLEGLRERFLPECTFRACKTRSSSTRCWPQQPFTAGLNRTCLMRSPGGRPWLLAVCPVRGGRLRPRGRQPGGCPSAPGLPGPGPEPWPPSAIMTTSGHSRSGHLTAGAADHKADPARCAVARPATFRQGVRRSGKVGMSASSAVVQLSQ